MKKTIISFGLIVLLVSCGNNSDTTASGTDTGTNPSVIEPGATQQPTGVTNQNVISTDTAAMNVEHMHDTTKQ